MGDVAFAGACLGRVFFAEIALRALSPLSITLHRVVWAVPVLWLVVRFKGYPLICTRIQDLLDSHHYSY